MFKFSSYQELIDFAKAQSRTKGDGNYYERHHIVPKSESGSDEESNLVLLTLYEHILAHYLRAIEATTARVAFGNLSAAIKILYVKKSYSDYSDKKKAVEDALNDLDFIALKEEIKKSRKGQPSGRAGIPNLNARRATHWIRVCDQKPTRFSDEAALRLLKQDGVIDIGRKCPICIFMPYLRTRCIAKNIVSSSLNDSNRALRLLFSSLLDFILVSLIVFMRFHINLFKLV
jgi:hypothetical protein